MLRFFRPLLMLLILLNSVCAAQADKVDDYIKAQMQAQHIPGLSLAVVRDGQIIKAKGYGFANLEWSVPVTTETLFQSGSVGKQFTATAVMMLVEDGKIGLEDKISQHLEDTPEAWKDITIHHLLTHTSGIGDVYSVLDLRHDYTEAELVKKASLDQIWTPVKLNDGTTYPYGFGWGLGQVNGHKIIEHDGAWQGFLSQISRYVEDKTTVIVFVNTDNAHSSAIAHTVASLYVPALAPPTRSGTVK